ncbi:ABC transporter ATP-binding protein [Roseovarius aestuarii]|nr:ABC transporter ATP-binding protein [Roseovarius aestuarii]
MPSNAPSPHHTGDDRLLEIRDLKIEGQTDGIWQPIIHGIDLDLNRGEILGLIGESGAGKSTVGLAAMGYVKPGMRFTGGSVNFDGRDLLSMPDKDQRRYRGKRIAYVAQSGQASFNPGYRLIEQTVEAALVHSVLPRDQAIARAIDLYGKLSLPEPEIIGFRYPHQVSGGQLQRAMTAMAMECQPDLIVFDEPTTALDVTTQVNVLASIRDIVQEFNTAAIYITHDLAVVAQLADRIKVLRYGREVEDAETQRMLSDPQEDYTKSLWAVRNITRTERSSDDIQLSVKNVSASYGKTVKVLKDIDIDIPKGRTVAVVGESGSGKSTLARSIIGLLPPDNGEVLFQGDALPPSIGARSKDLLRRIQLIYQSPDTALNPRQSVGEAIGRPLEFYLGLKGRAREARVAELLNLIELDESFAYRLPGELSGGQKQRICIARALAANPDLIICDEVTSALDQIVQEEILNLLIRLQEELGITYVFITHDIAVVRAIADEVIVMQMGKVVEKGSRSAVLDNPQSPYTQLLLSAVPKMDPGWLDQVLAERSK